MAIKLAKSMQEVVKAAFSPGNETVKFVCGEVSAKFAKSVEKKLGFSIEKYSCIVDVSGIRHAIGEHGSPKKEAARGQVAVTIDDFLAVPKVIMQPDSVIYEGLNKQGNHAFLFQKVIGNNLVCVEEVRTGRKEIALKTMYIKKATTKK